MRLAILALALTGCSALRAVDGVALDAHAESVGDMASESNLYIAADSALTDAQKLTRKARNNDTATFARKLAEAAK